MNQAKIIWYGVAGEGLGHSVRSSVVIQKLREKGYKVYIFGSKSALQYFASDPDLIPIPGLVFERKPGGRMSKLATVLAALKHALELLNLSNRPIGHILDQWASQKGFPLLVISDFEPFTSRWAARHNIPSLTCDHQHFLLEEELPPMENWRKAIQLSLFAKIVNFLIPTADSIIVSSFAHFPKKSSSKAEFVGCLISEEVKKAKIGNNGHICVYLKEPNLIRRILTIAKANPNLHFVIWTNSPPQKGKTKHPRNTTINPTHPSAFIESLKDCDALISTAGNQLIAEALYLGKPIWAIPTPGELEQWLNAKSLEKTNCGLWTYSRALTPKTFQLFLSQKSVYKEAITKWRESNPHQIDGTEKTLEIILHKIPTTPKKGNAKLASWFSWKPKWLNI